MEEFIIIVTLHRSCLLLTLWRSHVQTCVLFKMHIVSEVASCCHGLSIIAFHYSYDYDNFVASNYNPVITTWIINRSQYFKLQTISHKLGIWQELRNCCFLFLFLPIWLRVPWPDWPNPPTAQLLIIWLLYRDDRIPSYYFDLAIIVVISITGNHGKIKITFC